MLNIKSTYEYCLVSADPRQCYSCGYKKVNDGMMEEIGDLPFCAEFANPTENLVNCTVVDDCCAVMKEFREM